MTIFAGDNLILLGGPTPTIRYREGDQTSPAGVYNELVTGDVWKLQRASNSSATAFTDLMTVDSSGDLTLAGAISFTGITLTGDIDSTSTAIDWDLIDNNASALSFDSAGKTGIIVLVTTDSSEGVTMSGTLAVTGSITGTIGTATQNSITTMTALVTTGALASGSIASGFGTISTANDITTSADISGSNLAGTITTATQNSVTTMTGLVSTGVLDSGSITSGFGSIDTGSSDITTTGAVGGNYLDGTLRTVAQGNVTSLGTLTTLTVDDLTINGSTITGTANVNLDAVGDISLDADGGEIFGKDDGVGKFASYTNAFGIGDFTSYSPYNPGASYKVLQVLATPVNENSGWICRVPTANSSAVATWYRIGRNATSISNEAIGQIQFQSKDGYTGGYINVAGAGTTWTTTAGEQYTNMVISTDMGTGGASLGGINLSSNVGIGSSSPPTSGQYVFTIANGTAPTGSSANSCTLYSEDVAASSELHVRDEAGNITVLSPHAFKLMDRSEPTAWSYYSKNEFLGKEINVDVMAVIRKVEELSGVTYIKEQDLSGTKLDWDTEEQTKYDNRVTEIARYDALTEEEQQTAVKPTAYTKVNKPDWIT